MQGVISLCDIDVGVSAVVKKLLSSGSIRRRFLDIGLVAGTKVTCLMKSPCGDPTAYLIRGAVIAIRRKDAKDILVEREEGAYGTYQ